MPPKKPRTFIRAGRRGATAGLPHVEIPVDGMPKPVAASAAAPTAPLVFREGHKIADTATAKIMGRAGGLKKARNLRLVDSLGLTAIVSGSAFASYRTGAEHFVKHHLAELAAVAGGVVGSGPSTMVASAALQLAGSRFAFDKFAETSEGAWLKLGSSLANDSRQNLLAAYSHAVLEAQGREQSVGDEHLYVDDGKNSKS